MLIFAPVVAKKKTPFSYVYTAKNKTVGSASSFNFTSTAISAAGATRIVLVGITFRDTTSTGVTIGGVTASRINTVSNSSGRQELWQAAVPTGTTATIAVSLAGSASYCAIQVWAIYGANSTPTNSNTGNANNSAGPLTCSCTVANNGAIFAVMGSNGGGSGHTWTLPTEETSSDELIDGNAYHSAASDTYATGAAKTVSCSITGGTATDWLLLNAVAFEPA